MAKRKPSKRVKAGTSKAAAAVRKAAFGKEYIANGRNGTAAAIKVGISKKGAEVWASRSLRDPNVIAIISEATEKAAKIAGLSVDRTLREIARLAYSDVRNLFDERGELKPIHTLDDDTAATVASIEQLEEFGPGSEGERKLTGYTKKLKTWDKNAALEKAMKYHGLYKEDNSQKGDAAIAAMMAAVAENASNKPAIKT